MCNREGSAAQVVDISAKVNSVLSRDDLWLVTAADSSYFINYAPALIESCLRYNTKLCLTVINPDERCKLLVDYLSRSEWLERGLCFFTLNEDVARPTPAYYATSRFRIAYSLLQSQLITRALVIDVDSYLQRPVPQAVFERYEMGLWLREEEIEPGMQCLAGCSMFTTASLPVLARVLSNVSKWGYSRHFTDQLAIYEAYKWWADDPSYWQWYNNGEKPISKFIDFAKWGPLIDWQFTDRGIIWSGKGRRKFENLRYISGQNDLTAEFVCGLQRWIGSAQD